MNEMHADFAQLIAKKFRLRMTRNLPQERKFVGSGFTVGPEVKRVIAP
jgi:hypothetical protein